MYVASDASAMAAKQVVALLREGEQQQSKRNDGADGRNVIEQQMKVNEIHDPPDVDKDRRSASTANTR
jgi:hypothetical protein